MFINAQQIKKGITATCVRKKKLDDAFYGPKCVTLPIIMPLESAPLGNWKLQVSI